MEKAKKIIQVSNKAWKITTYVASLFMALSALLIIVNIITRKFFNAPIYGSTELIAYGSLVIAGFAIIDCEWADGNITLTIILDMFSQKVHYIISAIEHILMGLFYIVCDYLLFHDTLTKFASKVVTTDLDMPKWIFSGIMVVGFTLMTVVAFVKAILLLMAAKNNERISFSEIGRVDDHDY